MSDTYSSQGIKLVKTATGYWRIEPLPSEQFLAEHYASYYFQNPHGSYNSEYTLDEIRNIELKNKIIIKLLAPINNTHSVLDVGCGEGFLLKALQAQFGSKILGLDFSDFGVKKHNLDILKYFIKGDIYNSITNLVLTEQKFDFVILKNVLEHVREPEVLLQTLKKLLKPDGKLLITVPNDFSELQKKLKEKGLIENDYWLAPPEHLNYFTKDALFATVKSMGFEVQNFISDFPIEWFNANIHSNYTLRVENGKEAHASRVFLENYVNEHDAGLALNLWAALAQLGLGRTITLIATCED